MAARRNKSQARRNSGNGTPGWIWLLAGLVLGAALFFIVPGLMNRNGDNFVRPKPNPDARPAPVADADAEPPADAPAPAEKPAQAETAPAQETQYDFYTLLPGKEVQMSDAELAASAREEQARQAREQQRAQAAITNSTGTNTAETASAAPKPLPEPAGATASPTATTAAAVGAAGNVASAAPSDARYIMQAGAFGASGDAESTKARIAMLGLSARVESAQISGKTVYRVRMGPYGTASELADAKRKLSSGGLPAVAIKAQ